MRIFAVLAVTLLIFAAGSQLYSLQQNQSASLLHLFLSQPLPQQAAWIVILTAPVLLLFAALWGQERMLQHRRVSEALSAQLRGVRAEVRELETAQKDNEDAANYLTRTDPGQGLSDVRRRLNETDQLIETHHGRNEAADLLASIEQVREHQKGIRERLGGVIAKRQSIETMLVDLQRFQDEAEQAMARMEEDKNGDTLEARLRKLVEFGRDANFRCDEIERSMHAIQQQERNSTAYSPALHPSSTRRTAFASACASCRTRARSSSATWNA